VGPWRRRLARTIATLGLVPPACTGVAPRDAGIDATLDDAIDDRGPVPDIVRRDTAPDVLRPLLDPTLFDCTSLRGDGGASAVPTRASPIPIACALDRSCRTLQVSAHRGAGGDLGRLAPEDTLSAYRAGIAAGVEYVETDPRPTQDGIIVNMHDPTVDRTTDGTGAVADMTFAQVRALHIRTGTLPGDFSCERVPTLVELLQTCRGRVVVLVDANKTDRVDLLVQAIRDADAIDWAIFDTSDTNKIDRALAIEPRLHFMIRPDTVADVTSQLDHYAPRVPVIVELREANLIAGAVIVHARGTRAFIDVFGADLAATLNGDLGGYRRAVEAGADILQTDRPDFVISYYRMRGAR